MAYTLILMLVVGLIVVAVIMNALQQHKERLATLKRAEYSKLRTMLDDTEEVLANAANIPFSSGITRALLNRIAYTMRAMIELEPNTRDLKSRLSDIEKRLGEMPTQSTPSPDNFNMPENDKQLLSMIQGIKKLRTILRAEHARGNLDTQQVVQEDRRLESYQLRINVESQIKRGQQAKANNMLGSARQYYEKALAILNGSTNTDEYIQSRRSELTATLSEITAELKEGNKRDQEKKAEQESNDLDVLFAPKKKW